MSKISASSSSSSSSILSRIKIVNAFKERIFMPSQSFLTFASNNHYQTIIGSEAIKHKFYGPVDTSYDTLRERIVTDDNDFFDIDFTVTKSDSNSNSNSNSDDNDTEKGLVIVLHGLESNTKGPLVTRMATAFIDNGFDCCLVSFRGCSGEDNYTPGAYHLGFTSDLHHLVKILNQKYPGRPLYLSGFSLGGNVCLKFLGEVGEKAYSEYNIKGCAVTCVPFDPIASQHKIDQGFNRIVYSLNFLSSLKLKAERQILQHPNAFNIEAIRQCRTIGEFDDHFIAKLYNFTDKFDYYRKSGSKWFLNKIKTPTICINAIDDPFIEASSLPTVDDVGNEASVRLIYHQSGGHCGFISNDTTGPAYGWLAEELARALTHIHSNKNV